MERIETWTCVDGQPCDHVRWVREVSRVELSPPLLSRSLRSSRSSLIRKLAFFRFRRIKGIVLKRTGKDKLSPGMAFLVGAASKTLATIVSF